MNYLYSELSHEKDESHKGPRRKFGAFHFYMALNEIAEAGRIGRARISEAIGIGEGSARTLLDGLEHDSLIKRNNAGIVLTEKGRKAVEELPFSMKEITGSALSTGPFSTLAVIRGRAHKVTNGILQRDEAIKNGGTGAITMIVKGSNLFLPPDLSLADDAAASHLAFSLLGAREGDAVIIGSGNTAILAEQATFFAVSTLL